MYSSYKAGCQAFKYASYFVGKRIVFLQMLADTEIFLQFSVVPSRELCNFRKIGQLRSLLYLPTFYS
jgi:hypothetical protein